MSSGDQIAVAAEDNVVRIYDARTRKLSRVLKGHDSGFLKLAATYANDLVLSGSWQPTSKDHALRIWDARTGKRLFLLEGHTKRIWSVALSRDGRLALSGSADGTARLWDTRTGELIRVLRKTNVPVSSVGFSDDGSRAVTIDGNIIAVWDVKTGRAIRAFRTTNFQQMKAVTVLEQEAVTGGSDSTLRFWFATKPALHSYTKLTTNEFFLDKKDSDRPIVCLRQPSETIASLTTAQRVLIREIMRQAFLIAAREGLGLNTRDGTLREAMPATTPPQGIKPAGTLALASAYSPSQKSFYVSLQIAGEKSFQSEWTDRFPAKKESEYDTIIQRAESWSRIYFPKALEKEFGFPAQKKLPESKTGVPAATAKLLTEMAVPAQYAAIRKLHGLTRSKGASAKLYGGLVRGYSNLGLLTAHHWSPAHKAFKARALLYAERLVVTNPRSPWGYWHRAYARAMTGWHQKALDDLAKAASKKENGIEQPGWVDVLDAYCHFRTQKLEQLSAGNETQLAALLQFHNAKIPYTRNSATIWTTTISQNVLQTNPESFLIYDYAMNYAGLSVKHITTVEGPKVFDETTPERLLSMAGLPRKVQDLVEEKNPGMSWKTARSIC